MKLEKKPKCVRCSETLEEPHYFWIPDQRGPGGELLHLSCAVGREDTLRRVLKGLDKLQEKLDNRLNKEFEVIVAYKG